MNEKIEGNPTDNGSYDVWASAMSDVPKFNAEKTQTEIQVPVNYNEDGLIYATPEICREDNNTFASECQDFLHTFNATGVLSFDINEFGDVEKVVIPGNTASRIQNLANLSDSLTSIGKERQNKLADYGVFARDLYAICGTRYNYNIGEHYTEIFESAEQHFSDDKPEDYKRNMGNLITKSRWLERSNGDFDGFYEHFPGYSEGELRCLATAIATESNFNGEKINSDALDWNNEDEQTPYDPVVLHIFNRLDDNGGEDNYKEKVLAIAKGLAEEQVKE